MNFFRSRPLIKKQKPRCNQKLLKCSYIVILFVLLKLVIIYLLYILIRNEIHPESKETPKVRTTCYNTFSSCW